MRASSSSLVLNQLNHNWLLLDETVLAFPNLTSRTATGGANDLDETNILCLPTETRVLTAGSDGNDFSSVFLGPWTVQYHRGEYCDENSNRVAAKNDSGGIQNVLGVLSPIENSNKTSGNHSGDLNSVDLRGHDTANFKGASVRCRCVISCCSISNNAGQAMMVVGCLLVCLLGIQGSFQPFQLATLNSSMIRISQRQSASTQSRADCFGIETNRGQVGVLSRRRSPVSRHLETVRGCSVLHLVFVMLTLVSIVNSVEEVIPVTGINLNVTIAAMFARMMVSEENEAFYNCFAKAAVDDLNAEKGSLTFAVKIIDISILRMINDAQMKEGEDYARHYAESLAQEANEARVIAVIGAAYSSDAEVLAPALASVDIPLISNSATAAMLSNQTEYPLFGRVCLPDSKQVLAIVDTVKRFGWNRIGVVQCPDVYCRGLAEGVQRNLFAAGLKVDFTGE